jgi:hypothetical protein
MHRPLGIVDDDLAARTTSDATIDLPEDRGVPVGRLLERLAIACPDPPPPEEGLLPQPSSGRRRR